MKMRLIHKLFISLLLDRCSYRWPYINIAAPLCRWTKYFPSEQAVQNIILQKYVNRTSEMEWQTRSFLWDRQLNRWPRHSLIWEHPQRATLETLQKPFKKRVNGNNSKFCDKICSIYILGEDPGLSGNSIPALSQLLPHSSQENFIWIHCKNVCLQYTAS